MPRNRIGRRGFIVGLRGLRGVRKGLEGFEEVEATSKNTEITKRFFVLFVFHVISELLTL
jgi:hypothetical protein